MARTKSQPATVPDAPGPMPATSDRALRRFLALGIILAVWIAYATSFSGTFVFDDENQILFNPDVTESSIPELLASSTRPVVDLTLAMDYRLGGGADLESPDDFPNAVPFHVTNLVIHSLAALTLFGLVARTLELPRFAERISRRRGLLVAASVACLWAVHPLTTQAVTYIVQRAESLMGLFYLFTLYALLRAATCGGTKSALWSVACVGACALGMGSKAIMLTAPLAALAYDHTFLARSALDALKRRLPLYLGLACTWSILSAVGIVRGVFDPHPNADPTVGFTVESVTPIEYFLTQPQVILHYLRLALFPVGLTLDYNWPVAEDPAVIAVTTLLLGALGVYTIRHLVMRTWIGFAGAFFFLVLATTSSFIPISDIAFEHRMYLPLIPVLLLASVGIWRLLARLTPSPARVAPLLFVAAAVAYGSLTAARNLDYESGLSIWSDTHEKAPSNPRAASNYASMLARESRYAEALPIFERALRLSPAKADTHAKYARALSELGRNREAVERFERALELDPDMPMAMRDLAGEYAGLERWADVIPLATPILERDPERNEVRGYLVTALLETGRFQEAEREARTFIEQLDEENAPAYASLARALRGQSRVELAADYYERALEIDPADIPTTIALANLYMRLDRFGDAVEILRDLSRLPLGPPDPRQHAMVFYNLANTVYRHRVPQGDSPRPVFEEIIPYYERAVEIDPTYANAHYGLGWAYDRTERVQEAIRHYREALRIDPDHRRARAGLDALTGR